MREKRGRIRWERQRRSKRLNEKGLSDEEKEMIRRGMMEDEQKEHAHAKE